VGAGPVQLGDDISDGLADAGDFGEPLLLDQAVEGFGECSEAVLVRWPSTSCPFGGRVSGLLPTQALDGLYCAAGTMPAEEFEFLVLECVCGPEELFQLLPCPGRKVADVLQICLERGAVGHREHTVVPFLLALGLLLDLEDPDGFASKHHAG
jgi:hypothetical protein